MIYLTLRNLLFLVPPEASHELALHGISLANTFGCSRLVSGPIAPQPTRLMGLDFPNRVGLAAGLDKDGRCIDGLAALGFGFIEIGTVTPLAQSGNPRPRLFRLPSERALINRMGFNNEGVDALVQRVSRAHSHGVLGINIGKNKLTPNDNALADYLCCMRRVFTLASYITVNISSPNTPRLRDLQHEAFLRILLAGLRAEHDRLSEVHGVSPPLVLKIAPDLEPADIELICGLLLEFAIDGVIVSNTTLSREGVEASLHGTQAGGLSGAPLARRSDDVLSRVAALVQGKAVIIGVGGILEGADARRKVDLGADLVQLYTGFIYSGPRLISASVEAIGSRPT